MGGSSMELQLLLSTVLVAAAAVLSELVMKRWKWRWISESGICIAVGSVAGAMIFAVAAVTGESDRARDKLVRNLELLEFDPAFFTLILLPPIIFESGYSLNHSEFVRNVDGIAAFAFIGTLISFGIMASGLYFGLGGEGGMFTPMEAAAFAALIVAVDPVATLSVFRSVGADARLHALIFGESVLNDAMAIVLFKTVVSLGTKTTIGIEGWNEFGVDDFFAIVGAFCLIFIGSIAVGIIAGLALALSLKFLRLFELHNAAGAELILLVCASYSQFILAEFCGLSGIVSTLFCGATAVIYASRNLSPSARELTEFSAALLARFTEIIIFILIGFGFCLYTFGERHTHEVRDALLLANPQVDSCDPDAAGSHLNAAFIGLTLLLCLASRACAIFPLAAVVNACRSAHKRIAFKEQAVIWFSGLRGAIALALAVEFPQLPSTLGKEGEGNFCFQRDAVVACTIIVILCTVFVCGGLTRPMLWACGIQTGVVQSHRDHQGHVAATAAHDGAAQDGAAQDSAFQSKSRWKRALWRLDALYIRPRVIHGYVVPEGARARAVGRTAAEPTREASAFTPKRGFSPCKNLRKSFKGPGQEGLMVPGVQNTELSVVSAALGDSSDAAAAI